MDFANRFFAKKGNPTVIRRTRGEDDDFGVLYTQFYTDARFVCKGQCQRSSLRNWGVEISAEEAMSKIPDMDARERQHDDDERREWNSRLKPLLPLMRMTAIRQATDDELLAECQSRGWKVTR